jgi:hypothetical protein
MMCNKPTAVYWQQSVQRDNCLSHAVFGAFFEERVRCHDGGSKPRIDYDHFLANPIRITPAGPTTIPSIVAAHRAMCEEAKAFQNSSTSGTFSQSELGTRHFSLHPLYTALIIVIDDVTNFQNARQPDSHLSRHNFAEQQSVLLIRMRDKEFGEAVSFASLRLFAHTLCLRQDQTWSIATRTSSASHST